MGAGPGEHRGDGFVISPQGGGEISFSTFVLGLASTALIHLGETADPETGKASFDALMARQTLGLLDMLQTKTKGNLTAEEEKLFSSLLADLRLRFVKKSNP